MSNEKTRFFSLGSQDRLLGFPKIPPWTFSKSEKKEYEAGWDSMNREIAQTAQKRQKAKDQ